MEQIIQDQDETVESSQAESKLKIEEHKSTNSSIIDSELEVTSEHFNPLKALYSPDYRVTEKQPKIIYQNMAAFETALKNVGILGLNSRPEKIQASGSKGKDTFLVKEETTARRFQDHQMPIKTQTNLKSKHQRNLILQMSESEGPLKKLQEFVLGGRRLKVLIRKEHGVKGHVEGILQMFDRHWNLLLTDVQECLVTRKYKYVENKLVIHQDPSDCSDILKNLGINVPLENVKSLGRKKVEIIRHLPQLMLRGEHVVLISAN